MPFDVKNFEVEVIERSKTIPVVVDFWATWCSPCRVLGPILERLERQSGNAWVLAKVDTDRHQNIAAAFGISSIPNVKLFHEGEVVDEFIGAMPESEILRWLKQALPAPGDSRIDRAKELIANGKFPEATDILTEIVHTDPEQPEARVLLAKCVLIEHPEEARRLSADQDDPAISELADAVRTLADMLLLSPEKLELPQTETKKRYFAAIEAFRSRNYGASLQQFIDIIRTDRYFHNDGARRACIAIFKFLGEEHPVTLQYRREFSSALYV